MSNTAADSRPARTAFVCGGLDDVSVTTVDGGMTGIGDVAVTAANG